MRIAILAVTDDEVGMRHVDEGVARVRALLAARGHREVDFRQVADEQALLRAPLRMWADEGSVDLVITVGGVSTGLRQRIPEATLDVIERSLPGVPECFRTALADHPEAPVWRCQAGVRRRSLIVNLPAGEAAGRALTTVIAPLEAAATRLGVEP